MASLSYTWTQLHAAESAPFLDFTNPEAVAKAFRTRLASLLRRDRCHLSSPELVVTPNSDNRLCWFLSHPKNYNMAPDLVEMVVESVLQRLNTVLVAEMERPDLFVTVESLSGMDE